MNASTVPAPSALPRVTESPGRWQCQCLGPSTAHPGRESGLGPGICVVNKALIGECPPGQPLPENAVQRTAHARLRGDLPSCRSRARGSWKSARSSPGARAGLHPPPSLRPFATREGSLLWNAQGSSLHGCFEERLRNSERPQTEALRDRERDDAGIWCSCSPLRAESAVGLRDEDTHRHGKQCQCPSTREGTANPACPAVEQHLAVRGAAVGRRRAWEELQMNPAEPVHASSGVAEKTAAVSRGYGSHPAAPAGSKPMTSIIPTSGISVTPTQPINQETRDALIDPLNHTLKTWMPRTLGQRGTRALLLSLCGCRTAHDGPTQRRCPVPRSVTSARSSKSAAHTDCTWRLHTEAARGGCTQRLYQGGCTRSPCMGLSCWDIAPSCRGSYRNAGKNTSQPWAA
ncbi:uncharacterized protein LOC123625772 isoform X2 [Lemur catta]|uniref:uncharacterized protein LOC123625772 isoform X2 n=1 Tax=Lemur catta TaxID=9447 RepID=UPI001E26C4CA|nr:uncharacterized protein LOC123625772 isoform X2 [Lemur catta]